MEWTSWLQWKSNTWNVKKVLVAIVPVTKVWHQAALVRLKKSGQFLQRLSSYKWLSTWRIKISFHIVVDCNTPARSSSDFRNISVNLYNPKCLKFCIQSYLPKNLAIIMQSFSFLVLYLCRSNHSYFRRWQNFPHFQSDWRCVPAFDLNSFSAPF